MSFSSLSCLIALARTSIRTLNMSSGSRHLCLVPDLREKTFNSVPTEYNVSCFFVLFCFCFCFFFFFSILPLLCGGTFLLIPSLLRVFIMKVLYFVKWLFCIYWEDHVIFIFTVVIWFMYSLEYFEPLLYLRYKSYLFLAFNLFNVFTNYFSHICWKFFPPIFRKGWYSQFARVTLEGW